MITEYDITAAQGSDLNITFTVLDNNSGVFNLSGYVASGKVRSKYSDSGILLQLTPQVDPSFVSGLINLSVSGSVLQTLPITQAVYDINIFNVFSGIQFKVVEGYFSIEPSVTY